MVESGIVGESTTFDPARRSRLEYLLVSTPEAAAVSAIFEEGCVVVRVPTRLVQAWGMSDEVGIEAVQASSEGNVLKILIEKDLERIDAPNDESQLDAFHQAEHGSKCLSSNLNDSVPVEGAFA
jgi:hypothetical protein